MGPLTPTPAWTFSSPSPSPGPQRFGSRTWHTILIAVSVFCVKISPKRAPLSWTVNLPKNRLALNLINMGRIFPHHKNEPSYVTNGTYVVSLQSWYEGLSLCCYHFLLHNVIVLNLVGLIVVKIYILNSQEKTIHFCRKSRNCTATPTQLMFSLNVQCTVITGVNESTSACVSTAVSEYAL